MGIPRRFILLQKRKDEGKPSQPQRLLLDPCTETLWTVGPAGLHALPHGSKRFARVPAANSQFLRKLHGHCTVLYNGVIYIVVCAMPGVFSLPA